MTLTISLAEKNKMPLNELDALVEKAVVGGEKEKLPETFAEKAAKAEESVQKTEIKPIETKQYVLPPINLLSKSVSKQMILLLLQN